MDQRGLYRKYQVKRTDGKPLRGGGAVVLEIGDPLSWPAILVRAWMAKLAGNLKFYNGLVRKVREQVER
jgi:hypothetical protein